MRLSFKSLASLLIASTLLCACNGGKEDDHSREEFSATESLGIFKDGESVFTFLKNTHQYYCSPKDGLLRIIDNEGTRDVTIKLSAMPSSSAEVSGTVSGNMGLQGFSFSGLRILKTERRTVWLWSDKDKAGFILPSAGLSASN